MLILNNWKLDPALALPKEKQKTCWLQLRAQNQPNNINDQHIATSAAASGSKLSKHRPAPCAKQLSTSTSFISSPVVDTDLIQSIISEIADLSSRLPDSVPIGQPDRKIATSLNEEAESPWQGFNLFFDHVFGADMVDSVTGCFKFISWGAHSMDFVNQYLQTVLQQHLNELLLKLVHMWLIQIQDELGFLVGTLRRDQNREISAIDEWVFQHEEFQDLGLSKEDWKKLKQLEEILEIFTVVTNIMSQADTLTLPYVLTMYCNMEQKLTAMKKNPELASFSDAIDAGIISWLSATVCHPSFCLNWFGKCSLMEYQQAKILFEHVYESYATAAPADPSPRKPQLLKISYNL
ncbi:hypothetical protein D9758_019026 [Tetrapyrgos nigripes]|uniref:Uncharacterized protein n=1 Tax=Tetrapyrgos nigripes TaxID=182062 RepID=A0A8H5AZK3_9AGAR|nr:hypothetical protein D9758_019026 [Tetrapyrgos nigripes]